MKIRCPNCQTEFWQESESDWLTCPGCKVLFKPRPNGSPTPVVKPTVQQSPVAKPAVEPTQPLFPHYIKSKKAKVIVSTFLVFVFGILAVVFAVGYQEEQRKEAGRATGSNTPTAGQASSTAETIPPIEVATDVNYKFEISNWRRHSGGGLTFTLKVKPIVGALSLGPQFDAEFYDKDGVKLDETTVFVSTTMRPGDKIEKEIYPGKEKLDRTVRIKLVGRHYTD
jgi:DNA-directed RNA polymerase subunit RPC12/RpoP